MADSPKRRRVTQKARSSCFGLEKAAKLVGTMRGVSCRVRNAASAPEPEPEPDLCGPDGPAEFVECDFFFLNLFCSPHQLISGCFSSVYVAWLLFLELLVSSNLLLVLPD